MSLLTIDEARAQCRLDTDYPSDQLQPYMDAADDAAAAYLNRTIFTDQFGLDMARDAVPVSQGAAQDAYDASMLAAASIANVAEQQATIELATARFAEAGRIATRTIHGVVSNNSIKAAVRLILGDLFAHRESSSAEPLVEIPLGAQHLLRPYRRMMMP